MYLKITGSLLILLSCSYAGWSYGERYRRRLESLREWEKLLRMMDGEIRCRKVPLADAFIHIGMRLPGMFAGLCTEISDSLALRDGRTFRQMWETGVDTCLKNGSLTGEDCRMIKEFGSQIGYLDVRMQEAVIDQAVQLAGMQTAKLERTVSEKQKISRMLGVSAGICCVVMLI